MNNYIHQKKLRNDFIDYYGEKYLQLVQSEVSDTNQNWLSSMVRTSSRQTYTLRYLLLTRFLDIHLENLFSQTDEPNYQEIWDQRLTELSKINLSIREIAAILNSTPKTVRKRIDELGIEPFWKFNGEENT